MVTLLPFEPADQFTFTLDDGTGIWVSPAAPGEATQRPAQLDVGELVEVEGRTTGGRFSPTIVGAKIKVIGTAPLPPPQEVTPLGLGSGKFDSQRVVIRGIVQAADVDRTQTPSRLQLRVRTSLGIFSYIVLGSTTFTPNELVDSEVSLTGVCLSYFNSRRQFIGARVYTNQPGEDLKILRPGEKSPFAAPEISISEVMTFSPGGMNLHRQRVRGVVTFSNPGRYFFLQQGNAALRVNTTQPDALEPGDVVEAAGFFDLGHHRAEMQEAVFRKTGHETPPVPVEIQREQAFVQEPQSVYSVPQDFDDRLVSIRGVLVSLDESGGQPLRLNLVCDGALVPAEFIDTASKDVLSTLTTGSELQVTGICQITFSASRPVVDWPQPIAMRLLVRSPADVIVVRAAPFWTPKRLGFVLGILALVLLAAFGWVGLLRRQVAQRGQQLADEMRARRDAAVEFETAMRERNRLAADLHDTMEQSLTGLALQIEASDVFRTTTPERSQQHLSLARHLLARSREDLRRSIWNLRANPLDRQSLLDALKEIAHHRSAGLGVNIRVTCEGEERPLADFVAGNMLLLAQEGITNALKHASASNIDLILAFAGSQVKLTISDDGKGFDVASAAGPQHGHFGLQGMRERAKRLGGTFRIASSPGAGTSIEATVTD